MAVELKISIEENCDSIYVYECTGKYDKKCNDTGWGHPNDWTVLDATSAELHIYPPKSDDPIILDVYPDFPLDDKAGYEILPEDVGMEKFKSGIWRIDYQVVVDNGQMLLFTSCTTILKEDLACCLNGKALELTVDNFESKEVVSSNNHLALFESALDNASLGNIKETEKIIDYLYNKCNCSC